MSKAAKEKVPCWYQHLGSNRRCGGFGHLACHHALCYTPEVETAVAAAKRSGRGGGGKSGGKSGGKHGKSRGGKDQQLDFHDTHESEQGAANNKAFRLFDALLCCSDAECRDRDEANLGAQAGFGLLSSGQSQPRTLDFGRGPSGEEDLSWSRRWWLRFLFCVSIVVQWTRIIFKPVCVLMLVGLLVLGLPVFSSVPAADLGLKQGLAQAVAEIKRPQGCHSEEFLAMRLPSGYNCCGFT